MNELARNGGHCEFRSRFIGESQMGFLGMEGDLLLKSLLPLKPQKTRHSSDPDVWVDAVRRTDAQEVRGRRKGDFG